MTYVFMLNDRAKVHTRLDCLALGGRFATRHDVNGAVIPPKMRCRLCWPVDHVPSPPKPLTDDRNSSERIFERMDKLDKKNKCKS